MEAFDFCEVSCTVMKIQKIEPSDFCEGSCTGGHENSRKLNCLIFVKFHVPGGHKNSRKLKLLIFVKFHVPGVIKIQKIEAGVGE